MRAYYSWGILTPPCDIRAGVFLEFQWWWGGGKEVTPKCNGGGESLRLNNCTSFSPDESTCVGRTSASK